MSENFKESFEKTRLAGIIAAGALDEVAKEWEAIVSRVGKKAVQDAYAVGVKMEDNKL